MSIHLIGVLALIGIFVVGTGRPVNLGVLALVATFLIGGLKVGESVDTMLSGFPADLFVLLVGVTYLFGVASVNGTVEWIVDAAARGVGGRRAVIPWVMFVVAAIPTSVGALGPAGVALLAPIALRIAKRHQVDQRMAGLMVVFGSAAGNFSPLNALGVIVNGTVERSDIALSPAVLYAVSAAFCVVVGIGIFLAYGGLSLRGEPDVDDRDASVDTPPEGGGGGRAITTTTDTRIVSYVTAATIVAVAVAALVFDADIGVVALTAAAALHLVFPTSSSGADQKIAWGVVLLICGIITFVAALTRYGTVDLIAAKVSTFGTPLVTAILICAVGALVSAFASSAGVLGALIPLAVPFIQQGDINGAGLIISLAICATAVDATPFSTVGALCVASAEPEERPALHKGLLVFGLSMVLVAPVVTWLAIIVPSSV